MMALLFIRLVCHVHKIGQSVTVVLYVERLPAVDSPTRWFTDVGRLTSHDAVSDGSQQYSASEGPVDKMPRGRSVHNAADNKSIYQDVHHYMPASQQLSQPRHQQTSVHHHQQQQQPHHSTYQLGGLHQQHATCHTSIPTTQQHYLVTREDVMSQTDDSEYCHIITDQLSTGTACLTSQLLTTRVSLLQLLMFFSSTWPACLIIPK